MSSGQTVFPQRMLTCVIFPCACVTEKLHFAMRRHKQTHGLEFGMPRWAVENRRAAYRSRFRRRRTHARRACRDRIKPRTEQKPKSARTWREIGASLEFVDRTETFLSPPYSLKYVMVACVSEIGNCLSVYCILNYTDETPQKMLQSFCLFPL